MLPFQRWLTLWLRMQVLPLRRVLRFRVCEGTTVHAVEGITVGAGHQVKRLGIQLGCICGAPRTRAVVRGQQPPGDDQGLLHSNACTDAVQN